MFHVSGFAQTTRIGVMRHGDRADFYPGYEPGFAEQWGNPRLSDQAFEDIEASALLMLKKGFIPTVIVTSPFLRTRQTSQIVARVIQQQTGNDVRILIEQRIQETPSGVQGARAGHEHEALIQLPVQNLARMTNPINDSDEACKERVLSFMQTLPIRYADHHVLVVTHGDAVSQMLSGGDDSLRYITQLAGFFILEDHHGHWDSIFTHKISL